MHKFLSVLSFSTGFSTSHLPAHKHALLTPLQYVTLWIMTDQSVVYIQESSPHIYAPIYAYHAIHVRPKNLVIV